ncbi:hypothetical protein [Acinetobacter variabilis]|uniref:hypothetical protein n=1 Tax=Acinetobacter variabilis TaxID=70346 RepID=UPI001ABCE675|nr:hypothetical protein [Acinetobacter variabilis]MBO3661584.1 hypothetical protein [Acinetobacter variabilis]UXI50750.1 hypothetical protein N5980_11490 [Acinetobacter variabilis]
MARPDPKKLLAQMQNAQWSKEHDIYLIEHNHLPMSQLREKLPFSEEEIMARRKVLGLMTRLKQMKRLFP